MQPTGFFILILFVGVCTGEGRSPGPKGPASGSPYTPRAQRECVRNEESASWSNFCCHGPPRVARRGRPSDVRSDKGRPERV